LFTLSRLREWAIVPYVEDEKEKEIGGGRGGGEEGEGG
jgi:hypothetical protein